MTHIQLLEADLKAQFAEWIEDTTIEFDELTVMVKPDFLSQLALALRDDPRFSFKLLLDICGVDYLHYGLADWETHSTTQTGFSRGANPRNLRYEPAKPSRFAVVYHLLSLSHHHRIRLRVYVSEASSLMIDSVISVWPAANWYERETFDMYGILFKGHPDLRRIMTDYGFAGHPFRKDFPLIGKVEMRYDAALRRVVYEPVSIQPRVLEPKVIRHDHRYRRENNADA